MPFIMIANIINLTLGAFNLYAHAREEIAEIVLFSPRISLRHFAGGWVFEKRDIIRQALKRIFDSLLWEAP